MTEDYYAILGVAPRSEAAVIRAAYLALMRRYHPDKNDSPAAIERAQAVIAAFAVLGDAEKRLGYDWGRRRAAEAAAQPPPWRLSRLPRAPIVAALVLLLLVPLSFMRFPVTAGDPPVAPAAPAADVEKDTIQISKREAIAAPLAVVAPTAAPKPDVVQPVPIEPAVTTPQPRVAEVKLVPAQAPRSPPAPRERPQVRKDVTPEKLASASAKCRSVKPGAEAAICTNENLAALDRNVVTFYNQSLAFGNAAARTALYDSRDSFLVRRDACRSDACLQSVHLAHLRELSAIVESRPPTPPR